jgi:hypothetical protein
MTNIEKIYKYVTDINSGKYPELFKQYKISGAGFGPKFKSGGALNETSVIFYVKEKKDVSDLDVSEIIPRHINAEGINVITDVVPSLSANTLVKCFTDSGETMPLSAHYIRRRPLQGGISSINGVGNQLWKSGTPTDATLGLIVTDKSDGQVVMLSNNHVYGNNVSHPFEHILNSFDDDYRELSFSPQRDITKLTVRNPGRFKSFSLVKLPADSGLAINKNYNGDMYLQSGLFDTALNDDHGMRTGFYNYPISGNGSNPYGTNIFQDTIDTIGHTKLVGYNGDKSFGFINPNAAYGSSSLLYPESYVDGAIATLTGYDLLDVNVSNQLLNFTESGPYKFASKEEVLSLFDTGHVNHKSPLFRSGRRNGAVGKGPGGIGDGMPVACYNTVSEGVSASGSLSAAAYVPVLVGGRLGKVYYYPENIQIESNNTNPLDGGDSGSVLFACLSSTVPTASAWKCVGLNYAGNQTGIGTGFAIPIHLVVERLNIAPWNGVIPTLTATSESITIRDNDVISSNLNSTVAEISTSRFGQRYNLTNSKLKNTDDPAFGNLKFGNIVMDPQDQDNLRIEHFSLNSNFGRNIFSNSNGDVFAGTPEYYHKNVPLTYRLIAERDFAYGAVTKSGGGIIFKNNENNNLQVVDFLKTPFLTATDLTLSNDHVFWGKDVVYGTGFDTSLTARFNSNHGSTSALETNGNLSAVAIGDFRDNQPLSGWNEFNKSRTRYSDNYGHAEYKEIALNDFYHRGIGNYGTMDNDYLFLVSESLGYTSFINTTGLQMSAYDNWHNVNNLKIYPGKQTISIPDDEINFPNVIHEPLGEKGSSKVLVFDVKNNFTFTQMLTSKFRPGALFSPYGYERTQGMYKAPDGTIKYYYENPNLGQERGLFRDASNNIVDFNQGGADGIFNYRHKDRLTKRNGDYLAFTGVSQVEVNKPVIGADTFYIDIHKVGSDGRFTYHQQLTGSSASMGNNGQQVSDQPLLPITVNQDYSRKKLKYNFNPIQIINIEMSSDKLFVSLRNTGPINTGTIQVFERGEDDLYTFSTHLTAPVVSSFDGFRQHCAQHYFKDTNNKIVFNMGRDTFGRDAQVLGDYLFASQNVFRRDYDRTLPGSITLVPEGSSYVAPANFVTVTNLNNNTTVGLLTSNYNDVSQQFYGRDIIYGSSQTEKTHHVFFAANGWTETDSILDSGLPSNPSAGTPIYNKTYNCGLIRRNDTKSKILRVSNLALYNLPLSVYDAENGRGLIFPNATSNLVNKVQYFDLIELVENVPTITKRLSAMYYKQDYPLAYLYDSPSKGLDYELFPTMNCSFGEKNNLGNKIGTNELSAGKVSGIRNDGFGRIRLDDENYFKPISAYPYTSSSFIGNYNREIGAPANSISPGISSIDSYVLSGNQFPPFSGYEGAPG